MIGIVSVCAGCALSQRRREPPAHLQLGATARRFASPAERPVALRTSEPAVATGDRGGMTGSLQFTVATPLHTYVGGELEGGALAARGSNLAGAYAVLGVSGTSRIGSLALELASGWRTMRYDLDTNDVGKVVAEPRVRGQLWISSQLTLGAAAGATLGERGTWMAGIYLGIHSDPFGANR